MGCYLRHISIALLLTGLVACSGTAPRDLKPWEAAPAAGSSEAASDNTPTGKSGYGPQLTVGKPYKVKPGDTLYAVAFRLGIDFRELAARNGIRAPYTINVGQVLKTVKSSVAKSGAASKSSGSQNSKNTATSPAKTENLASVSTATPQTVTRGSGKQNQTTKTTQPSKQVSSSKTVGSNRPVSRWRWPSKGKVVRTFAASVHKGIDVAGRRGDPVKATAAGKVVYAGAGVTGYGSLIILKHNDTYLSAYGHNEQLLVSEGSVVKVGQQIATMGSSGTNAVKLHFELRRLGKPVDPLTLLPKR